MVEETAVKDQPATDLDEDAVDAAARAIWDEYPEPLNNWDKLPDTAKTLSRADFRRMARAAIRAYAERRTYG